MNPVGGYIFEALMVLFLVFLIIETIQEDRRGQ